MNPPAPRALIAEDEPLLAAALRQELARAWPALEIVATVGDGLSAVQQALALQHARLQHLPFFCSDQQRQRVQLTLRRGMRAKTRSIFA